MTVTLADVVIAELHEHLDGAPPRVIAYARLYCASLQMPVRRAGVPSAGLHPKLAALVRDIALDAAAFERLPPLRQVS